MIAAVSSPDKTKVPRPVFTKYPVVAPVIAPAIVRFAPVGVFT